MMLAPGCLVFVFVFIFVFVLPSDGLNSTPKSPRDIVVRPVIGALLGTGFVYSYGTLAYNLLTNGNKRTR